MANDWSSKEKIALLSDILEYGDQPDSWLAISNDLSRTFQSKKEGRYSIKNCKQEYKYLVDRYKSEWIQHGSSNGLKLPLAKYIWIQLKSIYQAELTYQLKENRKKLTEIYLQLETTINVKPNIIESTPITSVIEISTSNNLPQENDEEKSPITENISQSISDIQPNESNSNENTTTLLTSENPLKEQIQIFDQLKIKEEPHIEIPCETNRQIINSTLLNPEADISSSMSFDISSLNNPLPSDHLSIPSQSTSTILESTSSSRSTSRTSSETKIDNIKSIPTTPKYHVYFSPKSTINNNNNIGLNKIKPKRKGNDEIKEETENETINQHDVSSSTTEQSKNQSTTAPVTRRSINTRSVPNTAVEQEEEKLRRFSAMLSENPNSWQSQSMAIIQFLLSQKQGYLFEHEITDEIAPKYHKFIRHPIALDTIRKNLESNGYPSKEYFKRDIYLMLYNAMKYNPRHHHVHRSAKHLFNITLPLFNSTPQEIQGQITTKTNISLPITGNDNPLVKRQRTK